jgi:hypothetical protein
VNRQVCQEVNPDSLPTVSNAESTRPSKPLLLKSVAIKDAAKFRAIKSGQGDQIDKPRPVFRPPCGQGDGGEMLWCHHANHMVVPPQSRGLPHRLGLQARRGAEKLDRKSVNQKSLLFELAVTKFRKAIKQGRERDQQCPPEVDRGIQKRRYHGWRTAPHGTRLRSLHRVHSPKQCLRLEVARAGRRRLACLFDRFKFPGLLDHLPDPLDLLRERQATLFLPPARHATGWKLRLLG